ncbi:MAG: sigma-54 dependent transcriptional regulator [Deltaproteobacteria bacterium]|nr:sigma-54 dependent transcriptional regulator [Deltaproteobacteria bacterium]
MRSARILLAEDSEATRERLGGALRASGYAVVTACDGAEALDHFEREPVDLVLADHRMPRLDGLGLLRALRDRAAVPFVLYSAGAEPELASRAARLGATGCLAFPFRLEEQLLPTIAASLAGARRGHAPPPRGAARFLGVSPAAEQVRARIARLGPLRTTTLVLGETGVGKEVVARALHEESGRALLRSFAVTELAETLLEAELFGHERGAFTGAVATRAGLFEQAHGGTLLLDEIGDAPPALQAKLLRVLETGELRRVGGGAPRLTDVRVIAATHRDLAGAVQAGRFRRDLYYRLHQAVVHVPPLRERPEDVAVLVEAFLRELAAAMAMPEPEPSPAFLVALRAQPWPGNARQLRAALQAVLLWWDGRAPLGPGDLAEALRSLAPPAGGDGLLAERMLAAWRAAGGNQEAARRALGLSRAAWRHRWQRLGLEGRSRRGG